MKAVVRRLARMLVPGALALGLLSSVSLAHADLPPPDGEKDVGYGFKVDNLEAFPEYVLLAYPASRSNGTPTTEAFLIAPGEVVGLGRRSQTPSIYAMKKTDYEAWKAAAVAGAADRADGDSELLAQLFNGDKVVRCDSAPSPQHRLDESDPRNSILQGFRAVAIADGTCDLDIMSTEPGGNDGVGPAPKQGSCAGCAAAGEPPAAIAYLTCLGAFVLAMRRRPRSKRLRPGDRTES